MSEEEETEQPALRPGFASESTDPLPGRERLPLDHAGGYGEKTVEEAGDVWASETLCASCLSQTVCKVAEHTPETLSVIARCLAYLPGAG